MTQDIKLPPAWGSAINDTGNDHVDLYSKDQVIQIIEADRQKLENAMVDIVPPATQRERWMYQQGRLAERDPRTPGSLAHETQQCGEPIDGYTLAMKVREDLDRQACPDFYMTTAVESIVRHLASPQPQQQASEPTVPPVWVTDQYGGMFDDLTAGQGYRLGWNDCRAAMLKKTPQPNIVGFDLASGPDEAVYWDGTSPPTK
ncbi:hypothetical protein [Neopusillimonas maritima]|uniref:Uncharacterized protein n=1 Tax=Neopusillimonas maritima TaxID=2026239 RepID=A0A3A1YWR7_9BURK|nr:hypothetical protein [Neopusillimonas maritima]RIY41995.1 hypothetical protein CJP73_00675 [Neopusillimonas maritima]|tara:strand:+ start:581 stop:1186 length:606 start_codon:yes stop_codon:yes gene_type:complete